MTHPRPPSPRQAEILDLVIRVYRVTEEPVPGRLIADRLHMKRWTLRTHLEELHRKGWLVTDTAPAQPALDFLP